jgi:sensor c-di-GMP phosphodiesterase-like protein
MMPIPRKRLWIAVAALSLATAGGAAAGYLLGRLHTKQVTEAALVQDALQIQGFTYTLVDESRSLLNAMNASPYPYCSDAELAYFREMIYHAVSLRDAGRMRDGKLQCSALFGRDKLPNTQFKPAITRPDGIKFYRDPPPYPHGNWMVFLLQLGDSYVVKDPNFENHPQPVNRRNEQNMLDVPSQKKMRASGLPSRFPTAVKDRDFEGSVEDTLYATRCTPDSSMCTTAYGSLSAALWANIGQLSLQTALGALIGALLTLTYIVLYQRSRNMSQQLRRAIRRDRLQIVYQPIVELATGRIVEAEALARWTDEDGFVVSPDVFMRIAEDRGFVVELTQLVVRHALEDFGEVLRNNADFRLNINATATDLANERFLPMLENALAVEKIPAESIAIEVTESSTASKREVKETIHELRRRGHGVQIDDFGTGYSSLSYLKDLAVDTIKVDRSFTQSIGTDAVTAGILPQILAMAHTLNLQVIVEGIETVEQAAYFAGAERPVRGQGWFFGQPMTISEFNSILAKRKESEGSLAGVA